MCTCAFSSKLPAYEIRGMCNHMFHSSNVFEQSVFEQSASVIFCHSVNRIFEGYTHYEKNNLLAPGIEPFIFWLGSSCQTVTFLTGICITITWPLLVAITRDLKPLVLSLATLPGPVHTLESMSNCFTHSSALPGPPKIITFYQGNPLTDVST